MKVLKRIFVVVFVFVGILFQVQKGFSYAYNPWTTMTGEGIIAVNPFVFAPTLSPFSLGADLVMGYGILGNLDVFVNFADVSILPEFTYNFSWGMVRFDLGGNNIIALQASQYSIAPQYHFFWENDIFAAEANVYASFAYADFSTPVIGAYLAPVLKIVKDTLGLYVEVDPCFTVGSGFALNFVPGIWLGLGGAGQLSLAVNLGDVLTEVSPSIGLWYWLTFDTKPKK